MKPSTPYVRLAQLIEWLTGTAVGFTESDVRKCIRTGVIPRHTFPGARQRRKNTKARAYYAVAKVAAALGIDNPLSPSTTNTKTT